MHRARPAEKSHNLSGLPNRAVPATPPPPIPKSVMEKGTSRGEGEHGATATGRGNLDISAKHGELERLGGFIGVADNGWSSRGWGNFFK